MGTYVAKIRTLTKRLIAYFASLASIFLFSILNSHHDEAGAPTKPSYPSPSLHGAHPPPSRRTPAVPTSADALLSRGAAETSKGRSLLGGSTPRRALAATGIPGRAPNGRSVALVVTQEQAAETQRYRRPTTLWRAPTYPAARGWRRTNRKT